MLKIGDRVELPVSAIYACVCNGNTKKAYQVKRDAHTKWHMVVTNLVSNDGSEKCLPRGQFAVLHTEREDWVKGCLQNMGIQGIFSTQKVEDCFFAQIPALELIMRENNC